MKRFLCIISAVMLMLGGLLSVSFAEEPDLPEAEETQPADDMETDADETDGKIYTGKARVDFCLRQKPDENARRGAEVKKGKPFTMLENVDAVWCKIKYGRYDGYAKKDWLNFDEQPPVPDAPETEDKEEIIPGSDTGGKVYTGKVKMAFNLRDKPDATSARGRAIDIGKSFTMLENTNDTWCLIRVGKYEGYAKKTWLRFDEEPPRTGDLGMSTDKSGAQYICKAFKPVQVVKEPSARSGSVCWLKRYQSIYCLDYQDEWSKIQTMDGHYTGYVKSNMLFHFQSMNSFLYPVPGYAQWKMTGYVTMKNAVKVSDGSKNYGGNPLCEGDLLTAQKTEDGTVRLQIRLTFCDLNPDDYEYHDFTDWREAKEGDYIGGFTQYFGRRQGGMYAYNRKHNIKLAMTYMNDTVIKKNEEYSFLENVQPGGSRKGYEKAPITGGPASIGGGICHTSTLMYEAALSLPFLITEREPHTPFGNTYAPKEFDATVGAYSDLRFINTLPYDVRINAVYCMDSGIITVRFECMETVDPEILANWHRYGDDEDGTQSGETDETVPEEETYEETVSEEEEEEMLSEEEEY